ncbi:transposase [Oceaniserpentilla sp. 4NH20-0058]|uniref:alpha-amylase family glycosyl hydrolase n=1 Tax=Oceaniserpentilla sp. 4NH20-0058 TaxID=3127660 RepID=UPI003101B997
MPKPRKEQVSLEATPYYHCVSRCVRKAFLCGYNSHDKVSYEHRRAWLENELLNQSQVFAIDIAAYVIMSNHYHVVLHINQKQAEHWDIDEVIDRWHKLYKGNVLSQRYLSDPNFSKAEFEKLQEFIEKWRARLMDIGWFIGRLNEKIARQANYEDRCTGRFWEGRFKSQALLDEKALAACMAYVDLNPVRAKMAKKPETSEHTSVKARAENAKLAHQPNHPKQQVSKLMPFVGNPRNNMPDGLPFRLTDYLALIDITGRAIREDKRGHIEKNLPDILNRLGIEPENWLTMTQEFEQNFKDLVGSPTILDKTVKLLQRKRRPAFKNCDRLLA